MSSFPGYPVPFQTVAHEYGREISHQTPVYHLAERDVDRSVEQQRAGQVVTVACFPLPPHLPQPVSAHLELLTQPFQNVRRRPLIVVRFNRARNEVCPLSLGTVVDEMILLRAALEMP